MPGEGPEEGKWITRDRLEVPRSSTHSSSNPEEWGTFDSCFSPVLAPCQLPKILVPQTPQSQNSQLAKGNLTLPLSSHPAVLKVALSLLICKIGTTHRSLPTLQADVTHRSRNSGERRAGGGGLTQCHRYSVQGYPQGQTLEGGTLALSHTTVTRDLVAPLISSSAAWLGFTAYLGLIQPHLPQSPQGHSAAGTHVLAALGPGNHPRSQANEGGT